MPNVLIVDQSEAVCTVCGLILGELGFSTVEAANTLDVLARCQAAMPDVVIVDAGLDGAFELISALRMLPNSQSLTIFCSIAKADLRTLMAATDVLLKPFDRKALAAVFSRLSISAAA
jgi:two-component system chemotaxis response regulator CheY